MTTTAKHKPIPWSYAIPILLAACFTIGTYTGGSQGELNLASPLIPLYLLGYGILFCTLFHWTRRLLTKHAENWDRDSTAPATRIGRLLPTTLTPQGIITQTLIMLACWLPYLIGYHPGLYWYDTSWQLHQYYTNTITDHHPFLDTYLFGWFADLGQNQWGQPMTGLYLLIIIQQVFATFALTSAAGYLARYSIPWRIRVGVYLFFCLFPFFPTVFSSLSKDSLNAPFLILFILMMCELVRTHGAVGRPWLFHPTLLLVVVLACLTKKTGVYVIVPTLLLFLLLKQKLRSRLIVASIALVTGLLMFVAMPKLILPGLHVQRGETSEIIAVPLQQVANVARHHGGELTSDERALVERTYRLPIDKLAAAYSFEAADPVKGNSPLKPDRSAFIRLYVTQLVKHPDDYLGACGGLSAAWFSFDPISNGTKTLLILFPNSSHHMPDVDRDMGWRSDTLAGDSLYHAYRDGLVGLPVVNGLFYKSLWGSVLPFLLVFLMVGVRRRGVRASGLLILVPIILTALTLYAGPTSLYNEAVRYVLPLVCLLPVIGVIVMRMVATGEEQ